MMWWTNAGGQWLPMGLMMLLFWGALITLVVWLIRRARSTPSIDKHHQANDHADDLLAQRFARGEIDEAQFNRARLLLHPHGTRS